MGYHGTPYLHLLYSSCVWKLGGTPLKNWVSPMSSGCRWFRTQRTPANSKQRPSPPKHKREPFLRHFAKIDVQQTLWISPCQFHQLLKDGSAPLCSSLVVALLMAAGFASPKQTPRPEPRSLGRPGCPCRAGLWAGSKHHPSSGLLGDEAYHWGHVGGVGHHHKVYEQEVLL